MDWKPVWVQVPGITGRPRDPKYALQSWVQGVEAIVCTIAQPTLPGFGITDVPLNWPWTLRDLGDMFVKDIVPLS